MLLIGMQGKNLDFSNGGQLDAEKVGYLRGGLLNVHFSFLFNRWLIFFSLSEQYAIAVVPIHVFLLLFFVHSSFASD